MNLIWIKRSKYEWISIDLDTIKSFSSVTAPLSSVKSEREFRTLYVNNKSVASDHEQILYNALEKYLTQFDRGAKYSLQDSVSKYNKGQS